MHKDWKTGLGMLLIGVAMMTVEAPLIAVAYYWPGVFKGNEILSLLWVLAHAANIFGTPVAIMLWMDEHNIL